MPHAKTRRRYKRCAGLFAGSSFGAETEGVIGTSIDALRFLFWGMEANNPFSLYQFRRSRAALVETIEFQFLFPPRLSLISEVNIRFVDSPFSICYDHPQSDFRIYLLVAVFNGCSQHLKTCFFVSTHSF